MKKQERAKLVVSTGSVYLASPVDSDGYPTTRIAATRWTQRWKSKIEGLPPTERDEWAHFIVRACNAHDDLLSALEDIVEKAGPGVTADDPLWPVTGPLFDTAREAIALAKWPPGRLREK